MSILGLGGEIFIDGSTPEGEINPVLNPGAGWRRSAILFCIICTLLANVQLCRCLGSTTDKFRKESIVHHQLQKRFANSLK